MVRMPWLKMRLALALTALPGATLAISACGSGQPRTEEPTPRNEDDDDDDVGPDPIVNEEADDDVSPVVLPPMTADEWCGTPTDSWNESGTGDQRQLCPDGISTDGSNWMRDDAHGELRTEATSEPTCCFDRVVLDEIDPRNWDDGPRGVGRLLVVDGAARTARGASVPAWAPGELIDTNIARGLSAEARAHIARRWVDSALLEHASVASFARTTIELMAVGAPPSLVAAVQRAASDEIRHAQMCFAIASSYAGAEVGPSALAPASPRELDLARLAATTFVEACVSETIGAVELERAASRAAHPNVRRMLGEIAADEARHAELAWSTVGWAARAGGQVVIDAVVAAARDYAMPAVAEASPFDDQLAAHGLLAGAEQAEQLRRGWRELIEPLIADLAATVSRSATQGRIATAT